VGDGIDRRQHAEQRGEPALRRERDVRREGTMTIHRDYFLLPDGSALLALTRGKMALVDAADLPRLLPYRWCANPCGKGWRAVARVDGKQTYMHVLLVGKGCDHKNRNALDNRRANLRRATHSQNMVNRAAYGKRSRYKGVYPNKTKWMGKLTYQGRQYFSPSFETQEEAALWYNRTATELHGTFAVLNDVLQ
jgi:hypothetical protein